MMPRSNMIAAFTVLVLQAVVARAAPLRAAASAAGQEMNKPYHLYPEPMRKLAWAQQYTQEMDIYDKGVVVQRYNYAGNTWSMPVHDAYGSMKVVQSVDNGGDALCGTTQPQSSSYPQSSIRDGTCVDKFDEYINCTDWALDEQHIWQNHCVLQRVDSPVRGKFSVSIVPDQRNFGLPFLSNSTYFLEDGTVTTVATFAMYFLGPCLTPVPSFSNCTGYC